MLLGKGHNKHNGPSVVSKIGHLIPRRLQVCHWEAFKPAIVLLGNGLVLGKKPNHSYQSVKQIKEN